MTNQITPQTPRNNNLIPSLLATGWTMRAPCKNAAHIDRHVAEDVPCSACGGQCRYIPMTKAKHYRAFALCLECGHEGEF